MSDSDSKLDLELRTITTRLTELCIQQDRLERPLTRVETRPSERSERRRGRNPHRANAQEAVPNNVQYPEVQYNNIATPKIGHRMQIINSRVGQERFGTIEGFCRDGKVKIRTVSEAIVTRLPKNTRRLIEHV